VMILTGSFSRFIREVGEEGKKLWQQFGMRPNCFQPIELPN